MDLSLNFLFLSFIDLVTRFSNPVDILDPSDLTERKVSHGRVPLSSKRFRILAIGALPSRDSIALSRTAIPNQGFQHVLEWV